MNDPVPQSLKPRKSPIQARSGATVEAVHEAAIQVLLADGLAKFTTTRVADRAGVSVGTLYQYFPNKQALLFAILSRHFEEIAAALEGIPLTRDRQPLSTIAHAIADARDASFHDPARASFTLLSALAGLSRGSFAGLVAGPEVLERLRDEARLLAAAYLRAAAEG